METRTREIPYTVMVPETRETTVNVTVNKRVPVESVENYTVSVPVTTQKEVQVRRCTMVQQTVTVPVNANGNGAAGNGHGGRHGLRGGRGCGNCSSCCGR